MFLLRHGRSLCACGRQLTVDGIECPCKQDLIVTMLDAGDGAQAERFKLAGGRGEGAQVDQRLIGHRFERLVQHLPVVG